MNRRCMPGWSIGAGCQKSTPAGKSSAARHHADDRHGIAVEAHDAADGGGVAVEAALPGAVREDDHLLDGGLLVGAGEGAAERGREAEGLEEAGGHHRAGELAGVAIEVPVAGHAAADEHGGEVLEGAAAVAEVAEVGGGDGGAAVAARRAAGGPDEAAGVAVRERVQEDRVDDGEDRGVRADAERESQHRGDGEAGVGAELTDSVAEVLHSISTRQAAKG